GKKIPEMLAGRVPPQFRHRSARWDRTRHVDRVPHAEAAVEGAIVVAASHAVRQVGEEPDVAASEDDVFSGYRVAQNFGGFEHRVPPRDLAHLDESALPAI